MLRAVSSISSLLLGMSILLSGSGLIGILLALRATAEDFGDFTIGLIMAAFYAGYVVGAMVCPRLIHRVGHIRAFTAFAASCAAISLAYGLVVDPMAWMVLRLANGLALIGIYMVIESWINERTQEDRAQVFSVYMMANLVALAVGQYLILFHGVTGQGSFTIAGMLFAIGLLPIALTPASQPTPIRTERLRLSRLYAVSPVGFVGVLGSGLLGGSFWSFAAIYARSLGMHESQAAGFVVAAIIGGAILQWPIGWLSDRFDRRAVLLGVSVGTMLTVAGFAILHTTSILVIYAMAVGFGGFLFSIYGIAVAQTHDRFQVSEVLEATKGMLMVHGIGSALGPIITGTALALHGDGFPLTLAVMAALLGSFTLARLLRDAPVPVAEKTVFAPMETASPVSMDMDPRSPDPEPIETGLVGPEPMYANDYRQDNAIVPIMATAGEPMATRPSRVKAAGSERELETLP